MLILSDSSLADRIIKKLKHGPMDTIRLIQALQTPPRPPTRQGVYAILRKLIRMEVVVKHKKTISLNAMWIIKTQTFAEDAARRYFTGDIGKNINILGLEDGERVRYDFQSLKNTDAFWDHILYIIIAGHHKPSWYAYNPHCWFFLTRAKQERALRDFIVENGGHYLLTVGSSTPLDRVIKTEFDHEYSKYVMRSKPMFANSAYYINVIGDFIIETWIDPRSAKRIEDIYAHAQESSKEIREELKKITLEKGKNRLVISRDSKKAEIIRHKLAKQFYSSSS